MSEKKVYTPEEIEALAEQASQNAMNHFKYGINCGESVLMGFLDLKLTDYPPEVVAMVSGFGGGMGETRHTCGAVCGALMILGTMHGRKNPYEKETFEERVDQLKHEETGVYPRHGKLVTDIFKEFKCIECRDLCIPFEDFHSKDRARNCKKIIGFCAKAATKAALAE